MAVERVGAIGSEVEVVRLDKPILLTLAEVLGAICGGENIWK